MDCCNRNDGWRGLASPRCSCVDTHKANAIMKKTAKTGTVTDEQGRVRFHGAFTGGFSAGYFNTVGSSEGFQPAQFVSSRSNRASQQSSRSVADYMDEGDGLLGGKLSSVAGIDSFAHSTADNMSNSFVSESENLLNKQLLSELTVQVKPSDTIGKKLLSTMGWRLGQGIGPRVPKKRVDYFSSAQTTSLTIEIHPGADLSKLPKSALLKTGSVTFAPDDEGKKVVIPAPKLDMYGLGFDPRMSGRLGVPSQENDYSVDLDDEDYAYEGSGNTYRMSDVLSANARGNNSNKPAQSAKRPVPYGQQPSQANKRLKYTSGFAYNDEEDDVYSNAPLALTNSIDASAEMSNSVVLFGQRNNDHSSAEDSQRQRKYQENAQETLQNIHQSVENWLGGDAANPHAGVSRNQGDLSKTLNIVERCPSDNRPPLAGFHVARRPRVPPPHYPPPSVPSDFHPYHSFATSGESENENSLNGVGGVYSRVGRKQNPLDAAKARSDKMNEDVVSETDRSSSQTIPAAGADASLEPPKKASIFDLIKPEARAKLQSAINAVNPTSQVQLVTPTSAITDRPPLPPRPATPPVPPPPPPPSLPANLPASSVDTAPPARPMLTSSHLLTSTFAGLSQAFKNRFAAATISEGAGTKDSIVLEGMATASEYTKKMAEKAELKATEDANLSAKSVPKVYHLKGSIRTVTPWAPSALLCKRMNVRMPDLSKSSAQLGSLLGADASALDPVRQLLGGANPNAQPPVLQFGRGADATAAEMRREEEEARALEVAKLDVYQAPAEIKPDISVFKSIFEDSEDDEEEEEEDDEKESEKENLGKGKESEVFDASATDPAQTPNINFSSSRPSASTAAPMVPVAVTEPTIEETGPVRFVPSKMRTTIANRSASAGSGSASAKVRGTARSRTSFEDPDQDDDEGETIARRAPKRSSGAVSAASVPSIKHDEDAEDATFTASIPRVVSQNTVSFGGAGLAGRVRKGRTAAAGSLRERLLAQQREDAEEGEPRQGEAEQSFNKIKKAEVVTKNITNSLPLQKEEEVDGGSAREVNQSVRVAQSIIHKMNSTAAEDFLADLSAAVVPAHTADISIKDIPQLAQASHSATKESQIEGPALPALPQEAPVAVHRPTSRFAPPPPQPRPPSPSVPIFTVERSEREMRDITAADASVVRVAPPQANAMIASGFPSRPPHEPSQPPPPPAREIHVPHAQDRTITAMPSIMADAVLPPAAKFESSIQRLQNSLQGQGQGFEKERTSKKASKKEHKKSYKSHKSDKHKHKKDSSKKKDRKKEKKDSAKKSKKSRNNDSSSSDGSSDGSSSESD